MATLLADPPASPTEQPSPSESPGAAPAPTPGLAAPGTPQRTCSSCGAPMGPGQDWCLQCGAGAPGSLATRAPSWRSAAAILGATALLAVGAAAAAYAALSKEPGKARQATATVAQTPPTTPPPVTPTTPGGALAPTTPKGLGTPTTIKPLPRVAVAKPPKIPLTTPTPKTTPTTTTPAPSLGGATTPKPTTGGSKPPTKKQPAPILLDTNAAATYNPYGYPASNFGDPTLAVDGDPATGWTAQVNPAVAPAMAEGLVIDLKSPRKLSALGLVTSTPGMTVQVYGAGGSTLPASITDPAWIALSPSQVEKNKRMRIGLRDLTKAFRFFTLWIISAPAASIGTPQAPGHVSVNELELYPA